MFFFVEDGKTDYIATDPNRTRYIYFSDNELAKCNILTDQAKICPGNKVWLKHKKDCVWDELTRTRENKGVACPVKIFRDEERIYMVKQEDGLVYSTKGEVVVNSECYGLKKDKIISKNWRSVLKGVGKLDNLKGCKIKTDSFELYIESEFTTKYNTKLVSQTAWESKLHIYEEKAATIWDYRNTTGLDLIPENRDNARDIDGLLEEYATHTEYRNTKLTNRLWIGIIAIGIVLVSITLTILYVYIKKKFQTSTVATIANMIDTKNINKV
uniref:Uncharacterized protein n=1 Tax=Cacopsylla melanoneura TaxID=428564 RepID=A0A8D8Z9S6_9HEMI